MKKKHCKYCRSKEKRENRIVVVIDGCEVADDMAEVIKRAIQKEDRSKGYPFSYEVYTGSVPLFKPF